jgi:cysteine-rich repeat protein
LSFGLDTNQNSRLDDAEITATSYVCNGKSLRCGDGVVDPGEQCDDGNAVDTDACTTACRLATCGDGILQAGVEECDDGNANNSDACLNSCRLARCGDGFLRVGVEECDDGNADDTDSCTIQCRSARCGDGIVHAGVEACDDGNTTTETICPSGVATCTGCSADCSQILNLVGCDVTSPQNCGACGNVCPGFGLANDDVSCADPATSTCALTCRGENYDVNGVASDGCEVLHPTPPGHTQATAGQLTAASCVDGDSQRIFHGTMASDGRVHTPPVEGFNSTTGSAPDEWSILATGGSCINDYLGTVTTAGGSASSCYRLSVVTDKGTKSFALPGAGTTTFSSAGGGSYSDGSTIFFVVDKVCPLPVQENITYDVTFHL